MRRRARIIAVANKQISPMCQIPRARAVLSQRAMRQALRVTCCLLERKTYFLCFCSSLLRHRSFDDFVNLMYSNQLLTIL